MGLIHKAVEVYGWLSLVWLLPLVGFIGMNLLMGWLDPNNRRPDGKDR